MIENKAGKQEETEIYSYISKGRTEQIRQWEIKQCNTLEVYGRRKQTKTKQIFWEYALKMKPNRILSSKGELKNNSRSVYNTKFKNIKK